MIYLLSVLIFYWPAAVADPAIENKPNLGQDAATQGVYPNFKKDLAPRVVPNRSKMANIKRMQRMLKAFGYPVDESGELDEQTVSILEKFREEIWVVRKQKPFDSRTLEELELTFQSFM